jgi:CBS domain-containing protein
MLVKEIMTRHATSIDSADMLSDAAERMRDSDVGVLPVFESGRLTGMLTDRDLVVRGIAEGKEPQTTTVREIMTPRVVFVFEDQNTREAAQLMRDQRVRRLVVLNHNHDSVGILSASDLPEPGSIEEEGSSGVVNRAANTWPAEGDSAEP